MIAIFDLDDTLLNLEEPLIKALPSLKNMKHDVRKQNKIAILDAIRKQRILEKLKPLPSSLNLIQTCKAAEIEIHIITARGWHPFGEEITRQNLCDNGIEYDNLIICDLEDQKTDFLRNDKKYVISVEDNPYNHLAFKKYGVQQPYCKVAPAFDYRDIHHNELIRCNSEINI